MVLPLTVKVGLKMSNIKLVTMVRALTTIVAIICNFSTAHYSTTAKKHITNEHTFPKNFEENLKLMDKTKPSLSRLGFCQFSSLARVFLDMRSAMKSTSSLQSFFNHSDMIATNYINSIRKKMQTAESEVSQSVDNSTQMI